MSATSFRAAPGLRPIEIVRWSQAAIERIDAMIEKPDDLRASRDLLRHQSERIAQILEAGGISAKRELGDLKLVGLETGHIEVPPAWRNINLIPEVQVQSRRDHRAWLGAYLQSHPKGKQARYAVITSGERCSIDQVGHRIDELQRRLRRWREIDCPKFSIEPIVWVIEITIDAAASAHVHANVVYIPHERLKPAENFEGGLLADIKSEFLDQKRSRKSAKPENHDQNKNIFEDRWAGWLKVCEKRFGAWWRDNGKIENIDELIKYSVKYGLADSKTSKSTKPNAADLDGVVSGLLAMPAPIDEDGVVHFEQHPICELHRQLFRRKLVRATGNFETWATSMKAARLKPIKIGERWALMKMLPARALAQMVGDGEVRENYVLHVTRRSPLNCETFEPVAMVMNFTLAPRTEKGRDGLAYMEELRQRFRSLPALEAYEKTFDTAAPAKPALSIVHNGARSSREKSSHGPAPPPDLLPVRSAGG